MLPITDELAMEDHPFDLECPHCQQILADAIRKRLDLFLERIDRIVERMSAIENRMESLPLQDR